MSLATLRTGLQSLLAGITDIGVVTDYEPFVQREEDFRTYFYDAPADRILGWTITRESTSERDKDNATTWRNHAMVIRGYAPVGQKGFTEKAFQDLIEDICDAVRAQQLPQLVGFGVTSVTFVGPPQVRLVEARQFFDKLVHYVEITIACEGEEVSNP